MKKLPYKDCASRLIRFLSFATTTAIFCIFASAILLLANCSRKPKTVAAGSTLDGKFVLASCMRGADAIDAIEFLPDGNCVVTPGKEDTTTFPGSYKAYPDGRLMLEFRGLGSMAKIYKAEASKHTLRLSDDGNTTLFFVRPPHPPHPKFIDLVGIRSSQADYGEYSYVDAYELTADQRFKARSRVLIPESHTYVEYSMSGTWSYKNGIMLFTPEKSDSPWPFRYFRSFVTRCDAKDLWYIDPRTGKEANAATTSSLALPPPPADYHPASHP